MTSYRVRTASSDLSGRSDRKKMTRPSGRSGIRLCLLLALLCHTGIPENASGATTRRLDENYTSNNTTLQSDSNYSNTNSFGLPRNVTIKQGATVYTSSTTSINIIGYTPLSPRTFFINGTLNNNGSLSNNAGLGGKISIGSTGALNNAGTVINNYELTNSGTFNNAGTVINNFSLTNSGTFTNNGGLDNKGLLTNNNTFTNNGTLTNTGSFNADVISAFFNGTDITINPENLFDIIVDGIGSVISGEGLGIIYNTDDFTNNGTLNNKFVLLNAGTLTNTSPTTLNNEGLLINTKDLINSGQFNNSAIVINSSNLTNTGVLDNTGSGTFDLTSFFDGENFSFDFSNLSSLLAGNGVLLNLNGGTIDNSGTLNNDGFLINLGTLNNTSATTLNNNFLLVNLESLSNTQGAVANNNGIMVNLGTFTNEGQFSNGRPVSVLISELTSLDSENLLGDIASTLTSGIMVNLEDVKNSGTFDNNFVFANIGSFENQSGGVLNNDFLLVNTEAMWNKTGGNMTNNGLLMNFGTLTNDGTVSNNGTIGAFSLDNPLQLGAIYNRGTLNNTGDFTNRFIVYNDGELNTSGTFDNRFLLVNANNMENSGSMTNSGLFLNFGSFTNDGSLVNEGPFGASLPENASEMTASDLDNPIQLGAIYNGGNLTNSGTFENEFLLVNAGTLSNNTEGSMTNSGFILNFGTLANNGDLFNDGGFKNLGILKGNGTIYGYFSNDGIIAPGNSIGTLTFEGSYTHNDSAIYALEVDSIGNSDLIDVKKTVAGRSGNAILNGGLVNVSPAKGFYRWGTFYTILTAENEVFGTFDDVNFPLSSLFLVPSLRYDDRNVYLDLVSDFTSSARTDNQYAVASALDSIPVSVQGDMADVMTCLVYQPTVNSALKAIDRISGHIYTALPDASFYSIDRYLGAVSSHFGGFSMNDKQGIESGFWSSGFGGWGDRDGTDTSSQYTYELTGGIFGYDHKLSETLLLGVAAGYASTDLSMDNLNEKANVDSWQGSLYGLYKDGPLHIGLIGSYGSHNYTTTRHIDFSCVNRTASADYDAYDLSASLEAGYRIDTGKNTFIMPTASLQAIWLNSEAFAEKGASALNLIVDDEHSTTLPGRIGLTFGVETTDRKGGKFTPEVRFALRHDFAADNQYSHQASFAGAPDQSFTIKSDRVERDSFEAGATLAYETKSGTSIFVSYDANLASDMNEQAAAFGFRYTW